MRPHRSQSDIVVETLDVLLVEDEPRDEFLELLREIALEAIERRASWPGEPHPDERSASAPLLAAVAGDEPASRTGFVARWGRRRVLRWASVGVVSLALAATPLVVEARATSARLAAFRADPAVLAPVTGPLAEAWRVPGRVVSDQPDALLVVTADGDLRRLDPVTGTASWTLGAEAGAPAFQRCFPVDESRVADRSPADAAASEGDGGAAAPVACVGSGADGPTVDGWSAFRVVVLDPATGTVLQRLGGTGSLLAVEPLGRDLLVASVQPDGRLAATRWGVIAGVPVWQYLSAGPVGGPRAVAERRQHSLTLGGVSVDLATGAGLDPADARLQPLRWAEYLLPSGARATWRWHANGATGQGRVTIPDRARTWPLFGPPLVPSVTDGSEPSVLVVVRSDGEMLSGLDLRSGRTQWLLPDNGLAPVRATAQVDGVLLVEDAMAVTAIDVPTGTTLWSAPTAASLPHTAMVDETVTVVPVRGRSGAIELTAVRLDDGAELWRVPAPAGTTALTVVGQHLVATTSDAVIGLG